MPILPARPSVVSDGVGLHGDRLAGLIRVEGVPFLALTAPGETRLSLTVTEASTGRQYRFIMDDDGFNVTVQWVDLVTFQMRYSLWMKRCIAAAQHSSNRAF